ncbi:zinc ribbon domain-containing protein [Clostridium oceanicum]
MLYCKKCGNKLNEGDMFCGNCGQPVEENDSSYDKKEKNNIDVEKIMKDVTMKENVNYLLNMIVKPMDSLKNQMNKCTDAFFYVLALVLSLIISVTQILIIKIGVKSIMRLLGEQGGIFNLFNPGNYMDEINGMFTKMFIQSAIWSIINLIFLTLIISGIIKVMKNINFNEIWKKVFKVLVSCMIPLVFFYFIGAISLAISIYISIIFIFIGGLIYIIGLFKGLNYHLKLNEDKCIYVVAMGILINLYLSTKIIGFLITA